MSWLERLERELTARGVPRGARRRIVLELEDHLRCDPAATTRLGDPTTLAQAFADDLAAATSRKAAIGSFALLVLVGAAFSASFLAAATFVGPDIASAETLPLGLAAALGMVIAPQVAFAAGMLALLAWIRTRGEEVLPAHEAALLCRRAAVGLLAGAAALTSLGLYAFEYRAELPTWWTSTTLLVSVGLLAPVLVAAAGVRRGMKIRSAGDGEAGDVFDDLHIPGHRRPWLLFAVVATAAAVAVGVAGGADDGLRNAVLEIAAVTGGFTLLGRPLGLRA